MNMTSWIILMTYKKFRIYQIENKENFAIWMKLKLKTWMKISTKEKWTIIDKIG